MRTLRKLPYSGFSLVEIVLALGVVSVVVVAILGLLTVGLNSGRNSIDESLIAAMSRQVIGNLRQQPFPSSSLFTNATTMGTAYFDINGTRLFDTDGIHDISGVEAIKQGALYQCTVTVKSVGVTTEDPDGLGPAPLLTATAACMLDVNLAFSWPLQATNANSYSIRTALARYY